MSSRVTGIWALATGNSPAAQLLVAELAGEGEDGLEGAAGAAGGGEWRGKIGTDGAGGGIGGSGATLEPVGGDEPEVDGREFGDPVFLGEELPGELAPTHEPIAGTQETVPVGEDVGNGSAVDEVFAWDFEVLGGEGGEHASRGEEGVECFAGGRPDGGKVDEFGDAGDIASAAMRVGFARDGDEVGPERVEFRHRRGFPPGICGTKMSPRGCGPGGGRGDLAIDHRGEGAQERGETFLVPFECGQHFHDGLDGGDAMARGFASDAVIAGLLGDESDAWEGAEGGVERDHLPGLGPGAVDDKERVGRCREGVGGDGVGAREEEGGAGLGDEFADARVGGEFDALVEFAAGEAEVGDAGGADGDAGLAGMLEEDDAGPGFERGEIGAPADRKGTEAAVTGRARIRGGHRVGSGGIHGWGSAPGSSGVASEVGFTSTPRRRRTASRRIHSTCPLMLRRSSAAQRSSSRQSAGSMRRRNDFRGSIRVGNGCPVQ